MPVLRTLWLTAVSRMLVIGAENQMSAAQPLGFLLHLYSLSFFWGDYHYKMGCGLFDFGGKYGKMITVCMQGQM